MNALTTIMEKQPREGDDAFHRLVRDLSRTLGTSSGIDSADIDPQDLQQLMAGYTSRESDWLQYAWGDSSQPYTRNLVDKGNGKSNLLILVWTPGRASPIHDHANAHCVMKILKGSLKETLYDWPANGIALNGQPSPLSPKKETIYLENDVSYISDKIGLHKICNPDTRRVAVSLHLYTPPHALKFGFNLFEESTGRANHIQQGQYYSELGHRL